MIRLGEERLILKHEMAFVTIVADCNSSQTARFGWRLLSFFTHTLSLLFTLGVGIGVGSWARVMGCGGVGAGVVCGSGPGPVA